MELFEDVEEFDFTALSYEEGLAEIDNFFDGGHGGQPLEAPSAVMNMDDEFANLMQELDDLPDDESLEEEEEEDQANTTTLEDPFTGPHAPPAPSFFAPGPPATSIFENERIPYSPELPQDDFFSITEQTPPRALPEPTPSSGNRSIMQAEMRYEENPKKTPRRSNFEPDESDYTGMTDDIARQIAMQVAGKEPNLQEPLVEIASQAAVNSNKTKPNTANPKRRRKSSPVDMEPEQQALTDDSSPQRPPTKKQKASAPKKKQKASAPKKKASKPKKVVAKADEEEEPHVKQDTVIELSSDDESSAAAFDDEPHTDNMAASAEDSEEPTKKPKKAKGKGKEKMSAKEFGILQKEENTNTTTSDDESVTVDPLQLATFDSDIAPMEDEEAEKVDTPAPSPIKKATKPKPQLKGKGKATDADTAASTTSKRKATDIEPAQAVPAKRKRWSIGNRELEQFTSNNASKGVKKPVVSPRKTRKARKDEEDAKPNAAGAARRRRSAGGKGGAAK